MPDLNDKIEKQTQAAEAAASAKKIVEYHKDRATFKKALDIRDTKEESEWTSNHYKENDLIQAALGAWRACKNPWINEWLEWQKYKEEKERQAVIWRGPVLVGPKCYILVLDVRSIDLYQDVH